jgi:protein-S-isoprenylcysteine O-methyltransferase Ste14
MFMSALEAKIPPPIVALIIAVAMWFLPGGLPHVDLPESARLYTAGLIAIAALSFMIPAIASFRKAQTTINPIKPEQASALVTNGVFGITRNPMYVGLSLVLIAYAVFLSSLPALAGPIAFVAYISRFQIAPEERALEAKFGAAYADYKRRVRRWL